jgi:UDP-glucose 4-epimerase
MKNKIIITGGLGFIGHNLSVALSRRGNQIIIIDNSSHNVTKPWHKLIIDQRKELIKKHDIQLIEGNTIDHSEMEKIIVKNGPSKIIHTAAIPDARLSNKDPSAGFDQNLLSTKILLEIIRKNNLSLDQFTYFSSSMVYGDFNSNEVIEDSLKTPKGSMVLQN